MTAVEQAPQTAVPTAFANELRMRLAEAQAQLAAADAMDEPLLAQIAEADVADLRSLAARNDIDVSDVDAGDVEAADAG